MHAKIDLPNIEKTFPCLGCKNTTVHKLKPSKQGCAWVCVPCKYAQHAFSHEDMMRTVVRGLFKVPSDPKPIDVPEKLKVFIKSGVSTDGESEVDRRFVLEHVRITGRLPQVGKPLFAAPKGIKDAPPFMSVPYGEVVRVENPST